MILSTPIRFSGTPEERAANRGTHAWGWDEEGRCLECDARPSHAAADYPCGTTPPRRIIDTEAGA